jgi:hypothetical protein
MEAVRTSETSVDNLFTRQYNPEDSSEHSILLVPPQVILGGVMLGLKVRVFKPG